MPTKKEPDIRTYLIKTVEWKPDPVVLHREKQEYHTYKVQIPASWKVTYGNLHGGAAKMGTNYDSHYGHVLRIYESNDKQRAVFPGVISFIDVTKVDAKIKITEREKVTEIVNNITTGGTWERVNPNNNDEIWLSIGCF